MPWYCAFFYEDKSNIIEACSYYSKKETLEYKKTHEKESIDDTNDSESQFTPFYNKVEQFEMPFIDIKQERLNTFTLSIADVCYMVIHKGIDFCFLCNSSFLRKAIPLNSVETAAFLERIHEVSNPSNHGAISLLIVYLETNGLKVVHNNNIAKKESPEYSKDKLSIGECEKMQIELQNESQIPISFYTGNTGENGYINEDSGQKLLLYNWNPSLCQAINGTVTVPGKKELERIILELPNIYWIKKSHEFTQKCRYLPEMRSMQKSLKEFVFLTEVENSYCKQNSFLSSIPFDRSVLDSRSIYSRNNLEENSIQKYRKVIRKVESMKNNIELLVSMRNDIEKSGAKGFISILSCIYNCIEDHATIQNIVASLTRVNKNPRKDFSILSDSLAFVIEEGIDSYLDICRKIYGEKLIECQKIIEKLTRDNLFEIHLTDDKQVCISRKNIISSKKKTKVKNSENFNNSLIKKSKNVKGVFAIKETKTQTLYSTKKLISLNKIIKDTLNQIIEIEGRICKSILIKTKKYDNFLSKVAFLLPTLDLFISNMVQSDKDEFKKPKITEKVSIYTAAHLLFPKFQSVSYTFDESQVYVITGANMAGKSCYARNFIHIAVLAKIGCYIKCSSAELPIFDEIYFINSIKEMNNLTEKLLKINIDLSFDYKTPRRLVLIDELHCNDLIQLSLLRLLQKSRILTLFITHKTAVIDTLKQENFHIFTYNCHKLNPGLNTQSSVMEICRSCFPELIDEINHIINE
ncbi:hypothetical protein GINT2_000199 [Glugoides intestinalis]